jgi:hypothetical protein
MGRNVKIVTVCGLSRAIKKTLKMNDFSLKWFLFTKILIYSALIIIIILALSAVRYGTIVDYPKCNHYIYRKGLQENTAQRAKDPQCSDKERELYTKVSLNSPLPIHGCGGHHANSLDIGSLKTGDILVLSYSGARSWFSAITYGSVWTHPGLVYLDVNTNEPYILEAAAYKPPYSGNIVRIPLLKWMSINRNARAIALLSLNKEASSTLVNKAFEKFEKEDIGVEGLRWSWWRFLNKKSPETVTPESFFASEPRRQVPSKKTKSGQPKYWPLPFGENTSDGFDYLLTCHEVVINVLQSAGVYDKTLTACSYLPCAIYNKEVGTVNGYEYAEPEEISFDSYVSTSALTLERVCV